MRSLILPAKAVLLNVLSVAATYGILVRVFQHGIGMQALWGTGSYGAIDALAGPVGLDGTPAQTPRPFDPFHGIRVAPGETPWRGAQ